MNPVSKTLRAAFLGVALISFMVACAGYAFLSELRRPVNDQPKAIEFEVVDGDSTSTIAGKLRQEGLIRQPLLFSYLVRSKGLDSSLQQGVYTLSPSMTMGEIIAALQVSTPFEERTVQVIEGLRMEEIASIVGAADLPEVTEQGFLDAARDGAAFKAKFALLSALPDGASLEGYLFPDTYRIATTATVTDVIDIMLNRFDEQYKTFETEVKVERNVHEIVTMASIIQREAARSDEMPNIAAVFWNRLKPEFVAETGNGKLQADPTLQYVLGTPEKWWPNVNELTPEQIENPNPYNTRVTPGLPPGPISNPGLAALRASARPSDEAYLYFVASCNEPGAHNFATSIEEFQAFEQEYLNCSTSGG